MHESQVNEKASDATNRSSDDALTNKANTRAVNKAWFYVFLGGALEIIWASGLKYGAVPSIVVLISLLVSFDLIIRAVKVLPVGPAYAVFTGMGTVGMVVVEAVFSNGDISVLKVGIVLLLLVFIIGLKLTTGEAKK